MLYDVEQSQIIYKREEGLPWKRSRTGASAAPIIEDIFAILFDNREICAALLGPHGDIGFLHRIEEMLSQYSLAALREAFPERMDNLKYTYAYCVAGGVGLIKDWLSHGCEESPQHMAQLTFRLVTNTVSDFYPHS